MKQLIYVLLFLSYWKLSYSKSWDIISFETTKAVLKKEETYVSISSRPRSDKRNIPTDTISEKLEGLIVERDKLLANLGIRVTESSPLKHQKDNLPRNRKFYRSGVYEDSWNKKNRFIEYHIYSATRYTTILATSSVEESNQLKIDTNDAIEWARRKYDF
ncbi:MAG: hypothetical protein VX642_00695 [Bdellovibrionota bacterium]|nr:hypothetical protein [Bdellovibrionota bacterium]